VADQNFIDYVKICCRSGKGGAGSSHLLKDKLTDRGGPDGGDGGRGGHIILRGNKNMWTLLPLKYRKHVIAKDGVNGSQSNSTGAMGEDVILDVPIGTVAKDVETGEIHFEISEDGEKKILTAGGRGGQGNSHFATPTHQTPRYAQPGEPGKMEWKILELKLLADVGLVGFPNAGKSTLISSISAAKPDIANYAFTTLVPQLGLVRYRDDNSFVMADLPGIIENAHQGKGLGIRFLRHIERNSALLFVISIESDIEKEYAILLNELKLYNPELLDKKRMVALSKSDILDDQMVKEMNAEIKLDVPYIFISAVSGLGLEKMKDMLWGMIND
jgi:GTPase